MKNLFSEIEIGSIDTVTDACRARNVAEFEYGLAARVGDGSGSDEWQATIDAIDELLPQLQPQSIAEAGLLISAALPYLRNLYGNVVAVLPEPLLQMIQGVSEALESNELSNDVMRDLEAVVAAIGWTPFAEDAADMLLCHAQDFLLGVPKSQYTSDTALAA